MWPLIFLLCLGLLVGLAYSAMRSEEEPSHIEPFIYEQSFSTGELVGWASYPPNQDTAYDPYVYPGKIRPDDPGICLVVRAEPPWNEDQLLGAVKIMDFILDRSFRLGFRFYLKTVDRSTELAVHFPLADGRRLIYRLPEPPQNRWAEIDLSWKDLLAAGLVSEKENKLRVTALALTARISRADPSVPIHLGLDDIRLCGIREKSFNFFEPEVTVLDEWKERIPRRHYRQGEIFRLSGDFGFLPDEVRLVISEFIDRNNIILDARLDQAKNKLWESGKILISPDRFPLGLYRGTITARKKAAVVSRTEFTLFVVSESKKPAHPRLFFGPGELRRFQERLNSDRFRPVLERFLSRARSYREELEPAKLVFDIDQFPEQDWIASLPAWYKDRFMAFREALFTNAVALLSGRDDEAGPFARALLLQLSSWPQWNHPWMERRGFHTYYPLGEFAEAFAVAYDAVFDQLSEEERKLARRGLMRNYIKPAYRTYVEQNQVTSNSSNWISHIAGGALLGLMAIAWDDAELGDLEPWLTGFILKEHRYITTVFGRDGSYGEGFRYYNFAMKSFAKTIPTLKRIFGLDLSAPFFGSHQETLWSSIVEKNLSFGFGDTESYLKQEAQAWWIGGESGPMNNWAWLLELSRDPSLAWLYGQLKEFDTLQEVLHETSDIRPERPESLGTVRFFPDVGTAVFRSGWTPEDFLFVFRSGPFFNHQHLDQGSFAFVDHGEVFLEERYDGEHHYYDDPVYRSHAIQPISHNTILLNRNPQSQKVGDPKGFAPGMNDQARLLHWLDAPDLAFVAGSLEKVYVDEVRQLKRNVVFLKPRSILLIDEIVPARAPIEVNRLFHTRWKKDICPGDWESRITKGSKVLRLVHLAPETAVKEILREPHFLYQYAARPLIERGYLQISDRTEKEKLIFADLLSAAPEGSPSPYEIEKHKESVSIRRKMGERTQTVVLNLGSSISLGDWSSDALILASSSRGEIFLARGTTLSLEGGIKLHSDRPFYGLLRRDNDLLELEANQEEKTTVSLFGLVAPRRIVVNGRPFKDFRFDSSLSLLQISLPPGSSRILVFGR